MSKNKLRPLIFIRNIIIAIISIFVSWVIINNILTSYEEAKYQPLGRLVQVDGENMHVYTKGEGENTIVLLSGLGTSAPTLDFEPLINELSKNNKVVVVEPFGYGWSDITDKKRTVENIVEEARLALKQSGIKGPYVLMPHSISGIYSMYYANKYPDEIKGIIGIDPTLPKQVKYFGEDAPTAPKILSALGPTGIARLALLINPDDFLPITDKGTYSDENIKLTKVLSSWKGYNKNVVDELNEINNNINKTFDMSFPLDMPVLIFTTKPDKVTEDGKSNITFYETYLNSLTSKDLVVLDGHHYLHWTFYKEMGEDVNDFINKF